MLFALAVLTIAASWAPGAVTQEPVTLYYAHWGDGLAEKRVVDLFHQHYSNIRIELVPIDGNTTSTAEKLLVMAAADVLPDMFFLSGTQGIPPLFMDRGLLLDLTPYMERDGIREDDFVPNAWNYAKRDGRIWGWPRATFGISLGTAIIAYNMDMYDSAGLVHPAPGWTFEQLLSDARLLTIDRNGDGTIDQWGTEQLGFNWWQVFVWSNGGEILNDEMTDIRLLEPQAIEALQWLGDLNHVYSVSAPRSSGGTGYFTQGRAALAHVPLSAYRDFQGMPFNWGLTVPPRGPSGETAYSLGGSNIIGVAAVTEHPEEVWTFLKFLSEEWVHRLEVLEWKTATPNLRSVALSPEFLYQPAPPYDLTAVVMHNPSKPTPQHPGWPRINSLVQGVLRSDVFTGNKSADAAMREIADALRAILAEGR